MLKLRKLIKEHTWDREFGDPLPTFEDVMKKHQVNKLKEGWWDNMSDAAKKAYIKKHGEAPNVAGDDDYDMGEVPGSRAPDQDIEPGDPEMRTGDESQEELGQMIKDQQNYIEDLYEKGADREEIEAAEANREDMEREMEEKEDAEEKRGSEYSEDDPPPENKGDPDWEEFNLDAWGEKLDRAADDDRISGEDYKELDGMLEKIEGLYKSGSDEDVAEAQKLENEFRRRTSGKFPWRGEESPGRTGNELNQETLMIDGKQFRRISEGKINSKFIKYRIYDKIADEINKVEPDDFNLRDFNPLKRKLIQFVQREVKRDKKMGTMSVLKQAWKRSDFDDKVFGRSGIIDGWYKKSEKDFPKFLKRNSNLKWKNYNASSLTYGIGKPLYKIVDSLLDGINSLVPESKYAFSEFYERFKK